VLEVHTTDYHTAGEPFRIVTAGAPDIPGATVRDRREHARASAEVDRVRRLLCNEPRGHADMYGCFLVEPDDDGANLGVLFWHKDGYSTACGHGTIALGAWAVESGVVAAPEDGEVAVTVDVPSGRVVARVRTRGGAVDAVTFCNVNCTGLSSLSDFGNVIAASASAKVRNETPNAMIAATPSLIISHLPRIMVLFICRTHVQEAQPSNCATILRRTTRLTRLERDDFSSNRHHALAYWWSMIFSENRYPLFGIML